MSTKVDTDQSILVLESRINEIFSNAFKHYNFISNELIVKDTKTLFIKIKDGLYGCYGLDINLINMIFNEQKNYKALLAFANYLNSKKLPNTYIVDLSERENADIYVLDHKYYMAIYEKPNINADNSQIIFGKANLKLLANYDSQFETEISNFSVQLMLNNKNIAKASLCKQGLRVDQIL